METRVIGRLGRDVSEIGLGTWQLGGDWGSVSEERALAILRTAVEHGITFFDTADVYGAGRSEELIGRFLREQPHPAVTVATKLGRFSKPGGKANHTLRTMREHTEASLRRLGVDALDLTQLHCIPTEELRRGEVFDHLRALREEGSIRAFGVSVESMEEARLCLEQEGLASLQIIFNIFRQKPIHELFADAVREGVALIVRLPLASGLLSGKFSRETQFSADDHRNYNRNGEAFNVGETFAGLEFETALELVEEIRPFVPDGMTMAQFALRWVLDHEAVTTVIAGASHPGQARDNAAAAQFPALTPETHLKLREIYETRVAEHIRGAY